MPMCHGGDMNTAQTQSRRTQPSPRTEGPWWFPGMIDAGLRLLCKVLFGWKGKLFQRWA